jgi:putative tricarboxylic transport membrane protein
VRIDDRLFGVLICLLGIAVLWYSAGFPAVAQQHYGPAMFPTIIGSGLVASGLVLTIAAVRQSAATARLLAFPDWRKSAGGVASVALMLASILSFLFLGERIGFQLLAFATLLLLYLAAGRSMLRSIGIAIGVTVCLDLLFSKLLRVPLPRGLLAQINWW